MSSPPTEVSPHCLNRLSLYLRSLRQLQEQGVERISSKELAEQYHLSAALIRKDLAQFGEFGIRGIGYEIDKLIARLRSILGLDLEHRVAVVGIGRLGGALARYLELNKGAFQIVAAFDTDRRKVGSRVGSIRVHHISDVPKVVPATGAKIALLTVPPKSAQETCDTLTAAGVRAVLNFAPVALKVGPEITAKSVDVRVHLEELAFFLQS
jgi:redox-sensing transcriptional repressor